MTDDNGGLMPVMAGFPVIKAHATQSPLSGTDHRLGHTGAGGARSRAMSDRICPNCRRDTATSGNWNVT